MRYWRILLLAKRMHNPAMSPANASVETPVETPAPLPGVLVADHFVQAYGYATYRLHGTRDWLLTYTLEGMGRYVLAGQHYDCRPGDIVILPPGSPHDYRTVQNDIHWRFYWVHFLPRPTWLAWLRLDERIPGMSVQSIADEMTRQRIETAFVRLVRDNAAASVLTNIWQKELAENALEEVLLLTAQQRANASIEPLDLRVHRVLQHITEHLHEPLRVDRLAQLVQLSPSRLSHLFKHQTGTSIIETVLSLRLRRAARLLQFSSLSVQQVAAEVGFQSAFYFSRQFKLYYGLSPSNYR